ncbi:MAG: hypothetical protein HC896_11945 [Bacteroidales bacterium]|nr:hypothetical protein [Bacteroidales bacterium]
MDIYPISIKDELVRFIRSQQMFSWCIPVYFGETKDYFVITSPCFKNSGVFTNEANATIDDLYKALYKFMVKKNYNL